MVLKTLNQWAASARESSVILERMALREEGNVQDRLLSRADCAFEASKRMDRIVHMIRTFERRGQVRGVRKTLVIAEHLMNVHAEF